MKKHRAQVVIGLHIVQSVGFAWIGAYHCLAHLLWSRTLAPNKLYVFIHGCAYNVTYKPYLSLSIYIHMMFCNLWSQSCPLLSLHATWMCGRFVTSHVTSISWDSGVHSNTTLHHCRCWWHCCCLSHLSHVPVFGHFATPKCAEPLVMFCSNTTRHLHSWLFVDVDSCVA